MPAIAVLQLGVMFAVTIVLHNSSDKVHRAVSRICLLLCLVLSALFLRTFAYEVLSDSPIRW